MSGSGRRSCPAAVSHLWGTYKAASSAWCIEQEARRQGKLLSRLGPQRSMLTKVAVVGDAVWPLQQVPVEGPLRSQNSAAGLRPLLPGLRLSSGTHGDLGEGLAA